MVEKSRQDQNRERRRFWKAHIQNWSKSGLLQTEYCRQNNLNVHRFGYWKKKFSVEASAASPKFVQLPAIPSARPSGIVADHISSGLEIQLGNITIKLASNFNSEALARAVYIVVSQIA